MARKKKARKVQVWKGFTKKQLAEMEKERQAYRRKKKRVQDACQKEGTIFDSLGMCGVTPDPWMIDTDEPTLRALLGRVECEIEDLQSLIEAIEEAQGDYGDDARLDKPVVVSIATACA